MFRRCLEIGRSGNRVLGVPSLFQAVTVGTKQQSLRSTGRSSTLLPRLWSSFHSSSSSSVRQLGSSSSSSSEDTNATDYLYQHGIPVALHDGIFKALKAAYGRKATLMDLQQFQSTSPDALTSLANAVRIEQEKFQLKQQHSLLRTPRRPSIQLHIDIPHHRTSFDLPWRFGASLLDVAKNHPDELGEYMEGTCGGQMSCCTCHVYLEPTLFEVVNQLHPITDDELDMLDLAYQPNETSSRLGCQVVLTDQLLQALAESNIADDTKGDALDSLVPHKHVTVTVSIPEGVNNVWK